MSVKVFMICCLVSTFTECLLLIPSSTVCSSYLSVGVVVTWLLIVLFCCVCEGVRDLLSCVNIDLSVYSADLGRHLAGIFHGC